MSLSLPRRDAGQRPDLLAVVIIYRELVSEYFPVIGKIQGITCFSLLIFALVSQQLYVLIANNIL